MAVNNSIVPQAQRKVGFSEVINSVPYQKMISNTLKDRATANRFIASIVSAVATTPALQECTPKTVVSAALLGESLKLSPSPQLGHFYMVPFKQKEKRDKNGNITQEACTNAVFMIGYKGYIQLATRSGEYKRINAMPIKQGELIRYSPFDDEIELAYIEDEQLRDSLPTVGYYAMFEYRNGFKKVLYWSKEKMLIHADRYSAAFDKDGYERLMSGKVPQGEQWKYSSFWYKDFDGMACKTMLRQLISKWGIMSTELQTAYEKDGAVLEDDKVTFADAPDITDEPTPQPQEEIVIEDTTGEVISEQPADEFAELMG